MKKIVFDLDGVIRGLHFLIEEKYNNGNAIDSFHWRTEEGKDVCDIVNKDLDILLDSPQTKYAEVIKNFIEKNNGEIWTCQPILWRAYTLKWIIDYFYPIGIHIEWYNNKQKMENLEKKDYIMVDDYPFHKSYERIILIDRPYNQEADTKVRVKTVKELEEKLNEYLVHG